jgi:hypothetical protein
MKKSVFAGIAFVAALFAACGPTSPWPGYTANENGTWFIQHVKGT